MNESSYKFELSKNFWDCECKEGYIHSINFNSCSECEALKIESPNSRESEIKPENMANEKSTNINTISLIASGYEFTCPFCGSLNNINYAPETIKCKHCDEELVVDQWNVNHAYE